jgi:hypothetical protein
MQRHGPTDACVAVVAALVDLFGADYVYIVSKCGAKTQRGTIVWLNHYDFCERTGLRPDHVIFCVNRTGIEGDNLDVTFSPVAPPTGVQLEELCTATGRTAEQLCSYFGSAQEATASSQLSGTSGGCGKGVVARALCLTHFIDDRSECLDSVFFDGWLATEQAGGLAAAAQHGAMLRFGCTAGSKLPAHAAQALGWTAVSQRSPALTQQSKAEPATAESLWNAMTQEQQLMWPKLQHLRERQPSPPRGKPSAEKQAEMLDAKRKEKELKGCVGADLWGALLAYESASKRPPKAAVVRPSCVKQTPPIENQRAKWVGPAFQEVRALWQQRLEVDWACHDWIDVARLFGLSASVAALDAQSNAMITCHCCNGAGSVIVIGCCPLCDGLGKV